MAFFEENPMEVIGWELSLKYLAEKSQFPEAALRLLLTLQLGIVIGLIYRLFVAEKRSLNLKHVYFFTTGFFLGYWNFGPWIGICLSTVFATYVINNVLPRYMKTWPRITPVIITWFVNLAVLLTGYWMTETEGYDICWTMPQCILCLRMIGYSWDIYDYSLCGNVALRPTKPLPGPVTLLQILGFAFFPTAFLIGPQFSMDRYIYFLKEQLQGSERILLKDTSRYTITRMIEATFYMGVSQYMLILTPTDYLLTDDFNNLNPFMKLVWMGVWGRGHLYQYASCWIFTDAGCAIMGLTYSGRDDKNHPIYDGLVNIKMNIFNCTQRFTDYIESFNCNTNKWIGDYLYKRINPYVGRTAAQILSLVFLALWHGFHPGYFATFAFEFLVVYCERDLTYIMRKLPYLTPFIVENAKIGLFILQLFYTFVFMGFSLIPFIYRVPSKFMLAYHNTFYSGFILFGLFPIYRYALNWVLRKIDLRLKDIKKDAQTSCSPRCRPGVPEE